MKLAFLRTSYVRHLAATLVARYGSKALEAMVYAVAARTIGQDAVGLVFVASASSAVAYRVLDLGLFPVLVRSAARNELDPATYAWLLRNRALGVSAIAAIFLVYSLFSHSTSALLLSGFFLANGLPIVHELPRAVMAGHERFGELARINLVTKSVESFLATAGLLLGFGLPAWLFARLLSHALFIVVVTREARRDVDTRNTKSPPREARLTVLRQGFVFFATRLLDVASGRVGVLLVRAYAGYAGAAQLGLSGKIQLAALGLLGAATQIAYPRLARDRNRSLGVRPLALLFAVSIVLGVGVYVGAPFAVRILVGRWDALMIAVVRTIAPVLTMVAVSRPLELWLEAKDHERVVLGIAALSSIVSITSTFLLVTSMGVIGAGWARVVQSTFETTATVLAVVFIVRRGVPSSQTPSEPTSDSDSNIHG